MHLSACPVSAQGLMVFWADTWRLTAQLVIVTDVSEFIVVSGCFAGLTSAKVARQNAIVVSSSCKAGR